MSAKNIVAWSLIGVALYDLILGQSSTPLPILGNYLTQQTDGMLIVTGAALLLLVK